MNLCCFIGSRTRSGVGILFEGLGGGRVWGWLCEVGPVGYFFSKEGDNNSYYAEEVFGNNKLL